MPFRNRSNGRGGFRRRRFDRKRPITNDQSVGNETGEIGEPPSAVPSAVVNAIADRAWQENPPKFAAWPLYFPCQQCTEDLCQVVTWCAEYLTAQKTIYCYEAMLARRQFAVDLKAFLSSMSDDRVPVVGFHLQQQADQLIACMGLAMYELAMEGLRGRFASPECAMRLPKINARFYNLPSTTRIAAIDYSQCGRLVSFVGVVVRATPNRLKCRQIAFLCASCKTEFRAFLVDGVFSMPSKCSNSHCRGKVFEPLVHSSSATETVDCQQLRLQELNGQHSSDSDQNNLIPKCIDCEVTEDLVGCCSSGSIACITGVVKVKKNVEARKRNQWQYNLYIDVNHIAVKKGLFSVAHSLSTPNSQSKELKIVYELMSDRNLFGRLVASFCPTIYGEEITKAGLLLALFGGSGKEPFALNRNSIHVFIVGDPGLGKTHLLRACAELSPNGVYVCGSSTTTSGLTVTCGRGGTGESSLEAGALVISSDGCCCIDEFDKMTSQQQVLLEVMEQQEVSIFKAGTQCQFPARVAVIAAANPVEGHYNRQLTVADNLKINSALLSRFDLIFLLLDEADAERDRRISAHVIQLRNANTTASAVPLQPVQKTDANRSLKYRVQMATWQGDRIPNDVMRKYVAFCKQMSNPHLSRAACKVLADFYEELERSYTAEGMPVGIRQMESLIRLTQARARCELREEATEQDALDVVEIMRAGIVSKLDGQWLPKKDAPKAAGRRMTAFLNQLRRASTDNHLLTVEQIRCAVKTAGLDQRRPFATILHGLNEAGLLVNKGGGKYELNAAALL